MPRIEKVLVANRGEIARRILRTVRTMGLAGVAVYSDADAEAPHVTDADEAVRIGPAPSRESYLAMDRIIDAARAVGADAVHPGYGFLAENAEFARRCDAAGLTFIGPPAEAIGKMGSKIEAKAIMAAAGVPVVPGVSGAGLSESRVTAAASALGFPVLVKAAAGGGGKGMRIVRDPEGLPDALAGARREAANAFGDDTLLLERYFDSPRHIEVQILADMIGHVVHCFERECSIQRRYQKVIEEAPSVAVDDQLRSRMGAAAVAAAKAIGYVGAGTVEFLVDPGGEFYFLEMNTRLQVEHPVTEAITGLDLVRLQILIAQGEPLPLRQDDLGIHGHAIEARLYAEDTDKGFLPATGRVTLWMPADVPGVRYDSGIVRGTDVGIHYDPLLAKIIAHAETRDEAIRRLIRALRLLGVAGMVTNRDFLIAALSHTAFATGALDTHFVQRHLGQATPGAPRAPEVDRLHAIVAALHGHERRRRQSLLPPSIPSGWRNNPWRPQEVSYRTGNGEVDVRYVARGPDRFQVGVAETASEAIIVESGTAGFSVEIGGVRRRFTVIEDDEVTIVHGTLGTTELTHVPRFPSRRGEELAGGCLAPMTGIIREIRVMVGDRVDRGTVMLVLEAMKMEHQMVASDAGIVKEIRVEVGQMVDPDTVLIVVDQDGS